MDPNRIVAEEQQCVARGSIQIEAPAAEGGDAGHPTAELPDLWCSTGTAEVVPISHERAAVGHRLKGIERRHPVLSMLPCRQRCPRELQPVAPRPIRPMGARLHCRVGAYLEATCRLAILAMVARLQRVVFWMVDQDAPWASISAMPELRATSSFRPL